jgi:hypothetical protein
MWILVGRFDVSGRVRRFAPHLAPNWGVETDRREDICSILIRAGAVLGFNAEDEDVTEEWREW